MTKRSCLQKKRKICLVCHESYPLFNRFVLNPIGGSEVRTYLLSTSLAKCKNLSVSVMVSDYGQRKIEHVESVAIIRNPTFRFDISKTSPPSAENFLEVYRLRFKQWMRNLPFKGLRSLPYRIGRRRLKCGYSLLTRKAFKTFDADIVFLLGVGDYALEVISYLHSVGKKVVIMLGSDSDLDYTKNSAPSERNRYGSLVQDCYRAICLADGFIVQTLHQKELLKKRFQRDSYLIRNEKRYRKRAREKKTSIRCSMGW